MQPAGVSSLIRIGIDFRRRRLQAAQAACEIDKHCWFHATLEIKAAPWRASLITRCTVCSFENEIMQKIAGAHTPWNDGANLILALVNKHIEKRLCKQIIAFWCLYYENPTNLKTSSRSGELHKYDLRIIPKQSKFRIRFQNQKFEFLNICPFSNNVFMTLRLITYTSERF